MSKVLVLGSSLGIEDFLFEPSETAREGFLGLIFGGSNSSTCIAEMGLGGTRAKWNW